MSDQISLSTANLRNGIRQPVSQNADFLDVSHAVTNLNASRKICERQSHLWPNAYLQTGCFLGRNSTFIDWQQSVGHWQIDNIEEFITTSLDNLLNHGEPLYIYPAHWLKTTMAIREEIRSHPDAIWAPTLAAALNRFLNESMRRKHPRRTAYQAQSLVARQ